METSISKITSVRQLVEALQNKSFGVSYLEIMKSIDIPEQDFERFYTWNKEHYTRNCLVRNESFELLLICWERGQKSPIHDFDANAAWIHTIRGRLKEECYRLTEEGLEKVSSVLLGTSEFSFMSHPITIHRYYNNYESRSVSLNLYSKPISKWKEYDLQGRAITREVSYDVVYKFDGEGKVQSF